MNIDDKLVWACGEEHNYEALDDSACECGMICIPNRVAFKMGLPVIWLRMRKLKLKLAHAHTKIKELEKRLEV